MSTTSGPWQSNNRLSNLISEDLKHMFFDELPSMNNKQLDISRFCS